MASKAESPSRDEVLKRMLKMPPKPHKPATTRRPDGKVSKKTKKRGK